MGHVRLVISFERNDPSAAASVSSDLGFGQYDLADAARRLLERRRQRDRLQSADERHSDCGESASSLLPGNRLESGNDLYIRGAGSKSMGSVSLV